MAGVLVGGSVGESPNLTISERTALMRLTASHVGKHQRFAVSISDNSIEHTRQLADTAGEVGADLLLISAPNYFTNNLSMLQAYFGAVSEFVGVD